MLAIINITSLLSRAGYLLCVCSFYLVMFCSAILLRNTEYSFEVLLYFIFGILYPDIGL